MSSSQNYHFLFQLSTTRQDEPVPAGLAVTWDGWCISIALSIRYWKSISTVYKGLKTETGGLYYNSETNDLTSDVSLWDSNYYFGSYSIELKTEESKSKLITCSSTSLSVLSSEYNSTPIRSSYVLANSDSKYRVSFTDKNGNLILEDVVGANLTIQAPSTSGTCYKWFNGSDLFDFSSFSIRPKSSKQASKNR